MAGDELALSEILIGLVKACKLDQASADDNEDIDDFFKVSQDDNLLELKEPSDELIDQAVGCVIIRS